jgi:hypothetical protein
MMRWFVNNEWENIWGEAVVAQLRYIPGIWLQELRKTAKNDSEESRCVDRQSNHTIPTHQRQSLRQPTCSAGVNIQTVPDTVLFGSFGLIVWLSLQFLIQTRIQCLKHEQSNIGDRTKGNCFLILVTDIQHLMPKCIYNLKNNEPLRTTVTIR